MIRLTAAASLAATTLLSGCDITGCDAILHPALRIEIVDASTGDWKADSSTGWAQRQGGPSEPLRVVGWRVGTVDTMTHLGVDGTGGGEYTVHVQRSGYLSWDRQKVSVKSGSCGVETTNLKAALEPAGWVVRSPVAGTAG